MGANRRYGRDSGQNIWLLFSASGNRKMFVWGATLSLKYISRSLSVSSVVWFLQIFFRRQSWRDYSRIFGCVLRSTIYFWEIVVAAERKVPNAKGGKVFLVDSHYLKRFCKVIHWGKMVSLLSVLFYFTELS